MNSEQHTAFTGEDAVIDDKAGGTFTAYSDYISGRNLELEKGKKIVQEWHASNWPANHISTVRYTLLKEGEGTRLFFEHDNIPAGEAESIAKGWDEYYWTPMKVFFEDNRMPRIF